MTEHGPHHHPTGIGSNSSLERDPERNPNGYCGLAGTGVSCPIGLMNVAE